MKLLKLIRLVGCVSSLCSFAAFWVVLETESPAFRVIFALVGALDLAFGVFVLFGPGDILGMYTKRATHGRVPYDPDDPSRNSMPGM